MKIQQAIRFVSRAPRLKKLLWRWWYQRLASDRRPDWQFMNYGYAPLHEGEQPVVLGPDDESHRTSIALYHRVAGSVDLKGREVLEVGSGRGGGSSFVKRYHLPTHLIGVDFSAKAVGFCRSAHDIEGLSFVNGDAEDLPFDDESFDAVLNVESSHCYGSVPTFLREVKRVLRPGGHFLFADIRFAENVERLQEDLANTGMTILEERDITANVLEALRLESAQKQGDIDRRVSKGSGAFREFAAVEGSEVFDNFKNRRLLYLHYVLRK